MSRLAWLRHREHWLHWVWCYRVRNASLHSGGGQGWHPACLCRLDWCESVPLKPGRRTPPGTFKL